MAAACSPQAAPGANVSNGSASPAGIPPSGASAPPERGAQIYDQNCVPCHRENGAGVPGVYPSLAGSAAALGDPVELAQWVLEQKRPSSIPEGRYPTHMLAFGWLKDADAAALLTYVRSHFGNAAPPVDEATIIRARGAP
jgi:mono/diheme cytochrome c family protein